MARPLQLSANDEARNYMGDVGWRGVNMRLDPDQLPEGFASKGVNIRFRDGTPEVRRGSMVIPWLNKISAGSIQPWGTVFGRGSFRDPSTFHEYELVAADGNLYACLANNHPLLLPLPAGVTVTEKCTFLQAFNVVLCLRGFGADPLVMSNVTAGFEEIEPSPEGTGLLTIPRCLRGVFMANRVFLLREDDTLVASDVLDYTHFTALNDLRINQGDADKGVALAPFGKASLVVLKERSVYLVDNVTGDLNALTVSRVTGRFGCKAAETVVDCGSDLLWLTNEHKVAALLLTIQNEVQASQGALAGKFPSLSDPLSPLFDRLAGQFAATATACLWNDAYYIAFAIDTGRMVGQELIQSGNNEQTVATVAGQRYVFAVGREGDGIINGTETITTSREFIAQGATVTLAVDYFYALNSITTASLKRVMLGQNNAMARYDFINQAWSGWDEAADIAFKQVFATTYVGRQRLFVVTHDGYVRLWEEGTADRLSRPYVDLTVAALPAAGNTLRVNGGTTVTADVTQSATLWDCTDLASARSNLWREMGGYRIGAVSRWTCPNALPTLLPMGAASYLLGTGLRFVSTNGVLPTVVTTGDWAGIEEVVERDVQAEFISRGYSHPEAELSDYHFLILDLQTWNVLFIVNLLADGVNEDVAVAADVTKDRTRHYFPFDAAPYDISNVNEDFFTAGREDYSIQPTDADYEFTPSDNVSGELMQEAREPWEVTMAGRSCRVQLLSTRGRWRMGNCRLVETIDDNAAGPIAS